MLPIFLYSSNVFGRVTYVTFDDSRHWMEPHNIYMYANNYTTIHLCLYLCLCAITFLLSFIWFSAMQIITRPSSDVRKNNSSNNNKQINYGFAEAWTWKILRCCLPTVYLKPFSFSWTAVIRYHLVRFYLLNCFLCNTCVIFNRV